MRSKAWALLVVMLGAPHAVASQQAGEAPQHLYGTWRWVISGGGISGIVTTPASCRCERYLTLTHEGTYEYVEQDSAHEFLLAAGRVQFHSSAEASHVAFGQPLPWLSLEHGLDEGQYRREKRVQFRGVDTLYLRDGDFGHVVMDGGMDAFHRQKKSRALPSSLPARTRLPMQDRPRRLPQSALDRFRADSLPYETPTVPIKQVQPVYPETARAAGVTGVVTMGAIVDARGEVDLIATLKGPPLLRQAACNALFQWRFHPAKGTSGPVPAFIEIRMSFPQ
jgi:hypothetical protein